MAGTIENGKMKKIKDENRFFHENLHFFDDTKKLITIEEKGEAIYTTFVLIGSVLFIIGLWLFLFSDNTEVCFFLFMFSLLFFFKGLSQYINYIKYKGLTLVLYHKNLKRGKTLRAYFRVDKLIDNKKFTIFLNNQYIYETSSITNNSTRKSWHYETIWSYETNSYIKVESNKTYIYFEIPIDKKTSATKTLPTDAYNLKRKIVWNLSIKEDSIFFPLNRKYELEISV